MTLSLIQSDIKHLLATDPVFQASGLAYSDCVMGDDTDRDIVTSLMRTIVGQQLSTKAANTIWGRVVDAAGDDLSPNRIAQLSDDILRSAGLSHQKISYMRGLCSALENRSFNPDILDTLDDEGVIESITALKGFGVWSAQMVMMFTLKRRDVWPSGDLGIREGVRLYKRAKERPDIPATDRFGNKFLGHRTAAALLLWRLKDTNKLQ